ncbi:Hypothetical protein D9617_13g100890 [Elsinoe fawcettii]|nr:Hypothetical protein D9617_13g100890 [Elsinoe fawcettii]
MLQIRNFNKDCQTTPVLALFDHFEKYFGISNPKKVSTSTSDQKVFMSGKAPVLFESPSRSVVVIGMCYDSDGERHLIIFDPKKPTPDWMREQVQTGNINVLKRNRCLSLKKSYLKSEESLSKYHRFTTLTPLDTAINQGSWDLFYRRKDSHASMLYETAVVGEDADDPDLAELARAPSISRTMKRRKSSISIGPLRTDSFGDDPRHSYMPIIP